MAKEEIVLLNTSINSFKGISHDDPIVIHFAQDNKKNKPITLLQGNQGTRKTSTIAAIIYGLCGMVPDLKSEHIINEKDGTINLDQEFMIGETRFRVHATKNKFTLERYLGQISRKGKMIDDWKEEQEPKTTLRELIGPIGISPMRLQTLDGARQIEWFRKIFTGSKSEELEKTEHTLRQNLKAATDSRKEAYRDYNKVKGALENNAYYVERQKWDSQFMKDGKLVPLITTETARQALDAATKEKTKLDNAEAAIPRIDQEIAELEQKLAAARERKVNGLKWIEENKTKITQEYNNKLDDFQNVSELMVKQQAYRLMVTQKEEMDEFETLVQKFDATKDDLRSALFELTKEYLPAVPGLQIKIASGFSDDEPEGIYYNDRNIATLSESELWQLFFLIWEDKDVPFVFVENVSSLGSDAISILNLIAKNGAKIFASQMDRKKDRIKITFIDEVK